jgi:hypothetical protein
MTAMKTMHKTLAGLAALGVAVMIAPAAHADPDGIVVAVVQQAQIDAKTGKKILMPANPVYSGDKINTDQIGQAQIKFRDNTKLVVGPNSTLVIDAFVFNKDNSARQVSISALRGAFRFISGNSPKDVYKITTPTATIGIRG